MPVRESAPNGAPCWVELFTADTDNARTFYGGLFGWDAVSAGEEYGGYINFSKEGKLVAGCMHNDGTQGTPNLWNTYLASDDAAAAAEAATSNGGRVLSAAMQVMDLGSMAMLADPSDAVIGVWQPGLHKGFQLLDEPGAPSWFELHTGNYDSAVEFYRTVFGWDTHVVSDETDFRYTTLGEGDGQLAGVMDASGYLPKGAPSFWTIYFATTDVDAAAAKVVELGGEITDAPVDTPYGRIAGADDSTGAAFKLRGPNAA